MFLAKLSQSVILGLGSLPHSWGWEAVGVRQQDAQSPGAPPLGGCTAGLVPTTGVVWCNGEEEGGLASLEASALPGVSCSSGNKMGTAAMGAALRTPWGMTKALVGQASTVVSPGLVTGFPATGMSPVEELMRRRSIEALWHPPQELHKAKASSAQARTVDGSFYHLTSAAPLEGTTSMEGTAASKPSGAEAGHKGQRWWSLRRQCPGSSESSLGWGHWSQDTSRSTDVQGQ